MPDKTKPVKHGSPPSTSSVVKTPLPAGITAPENEKPRTTPAEELTVKPASAATPPEAPTTEAPDTLNWNPAISASLENITSTVCVAHDEPSPPQMPQSSTTDEPPQSPAQSATLPAQSHVPSAIPSPLQTPQSS